MADDLNVGNINWLQKLAEDYLHQRRKERRNRFLFRLFIFLMIISAFLFGGDKRRKLIKDQPHVAIIDLKGGIFDKGDGSASKFIKSLHKVYRARGSKAVVIRINSPGGSPVQADYMYREIMRYRNKYKDMKVYAVCTDICASAAYYVASAADEIYANPSSLVGSIGVLFNGFGFVDAMNKLGIKRRLITAGSNKGFLDPFSPVKEGDEARLKVMLDIVHKQFEQSVMKGRGKRLHVDKEVFSGLFWTGEQAKSMGLIDEYGGVRDVARMHHPGIRMINYTSKGTVFERMAKRLASSALSDMLTYMGFAAPLR